MDLKPLALSPDGSNDFLDRNSTIPSRSSWVSVGRPIMKYSFKTRHPQEKTVRAVSMISSSVIFLLITSRRRWVPASGAMVKPVLRTRRICSMTSGPKVHPEGG